MNNVAGDVIQPVDDPSQAGGKSTDVGRDDQSAQQLPVLFVGKVVHGHVRVFQRLPPWNLKDAIYNEDGK